MGDCRVGDITPHAKIQNGKWVKYHCYVVCSFFFFCDPNFCSRLETKNTEPIFSARCNKYILRLWYDVSVRLSVMFVHCGHRVQ